MQRVEDGRCSTGVSAMDCTQPKAQPRPPRKPGQPVIVREGESLA